MLFLGLEGATWMLGEEGWVELRLGKMDGVEIVGMRVSEMVEGCFWVGGEGGSIEFVSSGELWLELCP